MTKYCLFCQGPVNPHDLGIWKQVVCWVLNDHLSSASLLQPTGVYAHNHCVNKAAEKVEMQSVAWKSGDPVADLEKLAEIEEIELSMQERIDKAVEDAFEVLDKYHTRVCIGENDGRCKCP